jgi:hypothetical protein
MILLLRVFMEKGAWPLFLLIASEAWQSHKKGKFFMLFLPSLIKPLESGRLSG